MKSVTEPLLQLVGWLCWLVSLVCIGALILAAASFAWHRRMGNPSIEAPAGKVAAILAAATVLGSASAVAGALLLGG